MKRNKHRNRESWDAKIQSRSHVATVGASLVGSWGLVGQLHSYLMSKAKEITEKYQEEDKVQAKELQAKDEEADLTETDEWAVEAPAAKKIKPTQAKYPLYLRQDKEAEMWRATHMAIELKEKHYAAEAEFSGQMRKAMGYAPVQAPKRVTLAMNPAMALWERLMDLQRQNNSRSSQWVDAANLE